MSATRAGHKLMIVWLVLAALASAIGLLKYSDWKTSQSKGGIQTEAERRSLLPVPIEELYVIEIGHAGALHRFERDTAGDWFYHAHGVDSSVQSAHGHVADPTQAAQIKHAFSGLGRARIERWLTGEDQQRYGVDRPETLLLVYGQYVPQPLAQYAVGDIAPDTLSRYVLMVDTKEVVTIANYQIENLLNLVQTVNTPPGETSDGNNKPGGS